MVWVCVILAILLFLAGVYEKWPALSGRLAKAQSVPKAGALELLQLLAKETGRQLTRNSGPIAPRVNMSRLERRLRVWKKKTPLDWDRAMLAMGVLEAYKANGEESYIGQLRAWAGGIVDERGALKRSPKRPSDCMCGYGLLLLYELTGLKQYAQAYGAIAQWLMHEYPRSSDGLIPYNQEDSKLLVDTIGMVCPFLAAYGRRTGQEEATELSLKMLDDYWENGTDPKYRLPYHAHPVSVDNGIGLYAWGRGVGWLLYGIVGILEAGVLPRIEKDRVLGRLEILAAEVVKRQSETGLWRWMLTLPQGGEDTSASAMIACSLARAIRVGIRKEDWSNAVSRAASGLLGNVSRRGVVYGASQEAIGVGMCPPGNIAAPWVQGPACELFGVLAQSKQK